MAITKTWEIDTLERDPSDGFVRNALWVLTGKDGDTITGERGGSAWFAKPDSLPSDFIAYESLDEATVLGWVKTQLGPDLCAAYERDVSYTTAVGKPW